MDLKQLLTVGPNSDTPSSSVLWFHLMNLAIWSLYIFLGIRIGMMITAGASTVPALIDSMTTYTLVVSTIITGNKLANMFITMKYGNTNNATPPKTP